MSTVWLADRRGQQGSDPPPPEADLCCEAEAVGWGEEVDILPPGPRPQNAEILQFKSIVKEYFSRICWRQGKF